MGPAVRQVLLVHEFGGGYGGAERYLETLAGGLVGRGVEVCALVFVREEGGAAELSTRLGDAGVSVEVRTGRAVPGPIRAAVRRHEPQVLHWNFVDPHAFQGASYLLLPWGRPSVITDHLPMLRAGWHRRITRDLANRRMARAIVVGQAGADAERAAWPHPPPTTVIPNGVPVVAEDRRRPPGGAHDPGRLVFVGRLTDQKGATDLPSLARGLRAAGRSVHLTVVGDGPLADALRAEADTVAPGQVELVGFQPDPSPWLREADVFVGPSRWEGGLPLTAREAMANGLPVVLSDIPPHHDLVDDSGAIRLVAVEDHDGWVAAVGEALDGLPGLSAAALRVAEQRSVERMVDETLAVYAEVTRSGRAGRASS